MTSLFGTVSTPLQPPGSGKKPFPVAERWNERQREKRERDRMRKGGAGRQQGRNESWGEEENLRLRQKERGV